jgi:hypothetical protein
MPLSGLLVISLISVATTIDYSYLSSNNAIAALTEYAYLDKALGETGDHYIHYYSSIFSNLSRGLPINEVIPNSDTLTSQVGNDIENPNPIDQRPQIQQPQETHPSNLVNNNP